MKKYYLIIYVLIVLTSCASNQEIKYGITFETQDFRAFTQFFDQDYNYLKTEKAKNEMSRIRYSSYSKKNIISTNNGSNMLDVCIGENCTNYENKLEQSSYSQGVMTAPFGDFDIRMYQTNNDFKNEILNINTGKILKIDAKITLVGTYSEDSLWFLSVPESKDNKPKQELIEVDPKLMEVKQIITNEQISKRNMASIFPILVNQKQYFYSPELDKLQLFDNMQFVDSELDNIIPYTEPNIKQLDTIDGKTYYSVCQLVNRCLYTDFEKMIELKLNKNSKFLQVTDTIYLEDKKVFLSVIQNAEKPTKLQTTFIEFDPQKFNYKVVNQVSTDENIIINTQLSKYWLK
ncbi:MAG: hypothetical protein ACRCUP_00945 [Mycoplasmatales bacterium]